MGCSDYIIRIKRPQEFMKAYGEVVHKGNARRSDRKILILPDNEKFGEDDENLPLEVFSMKESSFVANMLLIVNVKDTSANVEDCKDTSANVEDCKDTSANVEDCKSFDLVTHKFTGADNTTLPVLLDRWNSCGTFDKEVNLFPHDMTNLFGKIFKVACFTYKPFVILDVDTVREPTGRDGVEIRLVEEFCRWVNCTIEIVREDAAQWGEIYTNDTGGVGVIGSVVADRADVGIGALYYWYQEYVHLDFSAPVVRCAVTCLAPAPRLISSWRMPLMPFTWDTWVGVVCIYLCASIGLMISYGCVTTSHPFLKVFGMMIEQAVVEDNVSWKVRRVAGWMLVSSLVLSSAYGAGLATVFTVPRYENSINTVQDLVDRKMEWGATHDAWIFSLVLSSNPLMKELVNQFRIYSPEELERRSYTESMAFATEMLPRGHVATGDYLTQRALLNMLLMREDFYYAYCVIMLRKSSVYTEKINQLVNRLHQSGLLLAWETLISTKHLNSKLQLEVMLSRSKSDVSNAKPLRLSGVSGVFMLYGMGLAVSVATFIGELYMHRRGNNELLYLARVVK